MARKKFGGEGRNLGTEFHLNIIPILDCLTILVTFMLAAGVYISIAVLNVSVAAGGTTLTDQDAPKVNIEVNLKNDHSMMVRISGEVTKDVRIKVRGGKWDHEGLIRELMDAKKRWPEVKQLTLVAHKDVPYEDIVTAMDASMNTHPKVSLGGF